MSPVYSGPGHCPICEREVTFSAAYDWFRDHLLCSGCGSLPRERALMRVLTEFYPDYKRLVLHESSPSGGGLSAKLVTTCPEYTYSQYFPDVALGSLHPERGERCENLEALTFANGSFDVFITQDVVEHLFDPEKAFQEIDRVLKPGGAHVFTVPLVNKTRPTERRAKLGDNGEIKHLSEPEYHENPVDAQGSLVTMHWGYDISHCILTACGAPSVIVQIDDMSAGIRAEFIEVVVTQKRS